jgi:hypothetical protein
MTGLALGDAGRAAEQARAFREAGATRLVHGGRYADAEEFRRAVEVLGAQVRRALA